MPGPVLFLARTGLPASDWVSLRGSCCLHGSLTVHGRRHGPSCKAVYIFEQRTAYVIHRLAHKKMAAQGGHVLNVQ